jgi:signal transduction histidine kinase
MFREAEETIDAREQVLKIVSHDLRNPLHTISMSASLLLEVPVPPDKLADHLQRIKRAGQRMNRLIQDLLDVAKLETGRVGIDAKTIEVAPLLREAHEMLALLAAEKSIRLDVNIADRCRRSPPTGDACCRSSRTSSGTPSSSLRPAAAL